MRLPRPWLTRRGATLIRYSTIAVLVTLFFSKHLYEARHGRPMSLTEVSSMGGVQLMVVTEGGPSQFLSPIRAEAPPDTEWRTYLPLLRAELGIYTDRMLRESGLRSVVLCDRVTYKGQAAAGLPSFAEGRIYLAVPAQSVSKDFARRSVHHELFHLVDYRQGAASGSDPGWANLNDRAFHYGKGGWHEIALGAHLPDESVPGFLNRYSRSGPEEDKAEIYAHMMAGRELVEGRARSDEMVRSKCAELKARFSRYFPEMDPTFWEKGHESRHD
jgi:hypothetical protein